MKAHNRVDRVGQRFNKWLVLEQEGSTVTVVCECGHVRRNTDTYNITSGKSRGCFSCAKTGTRKRNGKVLPVKDPMNPAYRAERAVWRAMIARCYNPKNGSYKDYGARGIRVSPELLVFESYWAMKSTLPGWTGVHNAKHSLDRIDNDGDYTRANLRIADRTTQMLNRRRLRTSVLGSRIGKLVAVGKDGKNIVFKCDCGGELRAQTGNVRRRQPQSQRCKGEGCTE